MKVLLLTNASAGRGRGAAVVERVQGALRGAGHDVTRLAVDVSDLVRFAAAFADRLQGADVLVVAGGDGTVHHALGAIVEGRVPVYHVPLGTENLFARHFGMTREAGDLVGVLARFDPCVECVDVARTSWDSHSRLFGIMASIGPDASVVARLAAVRRGGISHLSYVGPIVAELFGSYLPRLSVWVDGREVVQSLRGMLVVANSPEYALGVNPARDASMRDGFLDVVFMPAESAVGVGVWLARCAAKMQFEGDSRCEGSVGTRGKSVRVEFEDDVGGGGRVMQVDGESLGLGGARTIEFDVLPQALRVLVPASHADRPPISQSGPG